jgi:hypothetical protein
MLEIGMGGDLNILVFCSNYLFGNSFPCPGHCIRTTLWSEVRPSCTVSLSLIHTRSLFLFLFEITQSWVGVMLMKQPFFIGGIEDVEKSKASAFGAAGMFFFTFVISILYMIHDSQRPPEGEQAATRRVGFLGDEYGQVPLAEMDLDAPEQIDRGGIFT